MPTRKDTTRTRDRCIAARRDLIRADAGPDPVMRAQMHGRDPVTPRAIP